MEIEFDPPFVKVPDNWDVLWDAEKKVNMTESEIASYEALVQ